MNETHSLYQHSILAGNTSNCRRHFQCQKGHSYYKTPWSNYLPFKTSHPVGGTKLTNKPECANKDYSPVPKFNLGDKSVEHGVGVAHGERLILKESELVALKVAGANS